MSRVGGVNQHAGDLLAFKFYCLCHWHVKHHPQVRSYEGVRSSAGQQSPRDLETTHRSASSARQSLHFPPLGP